MTKKVLGIVIAIAVIFATSYVFAANNEMGNSMNKATNTVRNVVGGAENVVEDTATSIGNGVRNLGNTFTDGAARVTNDGTVNNNDMNNDNMNNNNNDNNNTGYTATRTATGTTGTGTFLGMSPNLWTWFVLAIAAIAIVGLVWYYAMQNKIEYNDNKR